MPSAVLGDATRRSVRLRVCADVDESRWRVLAIVAVAVRILLSAGQRWRYERGQGSATNERKDVAASKPVLVEHAVWKRLVRCGHGDPPSSRIVRGPPSVV